MYFPPKHDVVYGNVIRNYFVFARTTPLTSKHRPKRERDSIISKRSMQIRPFTT